MPLTDAWLRAAKPRGQVYKKADGGGLYIEVTTVGSKIWRVTYRYGGKQKTLSLGNYPLIGLAEAREARDRVKKQLLNDIDPMAVRRAETAAAENSFETIARQWHRWRSKELAEDYAAQIMRRLEADVFPEIGAKPIDRIEPPTILAMLRKIEDRGAITMAARVKEHCGQIFRFALLDGKCMRDPTADLRGGLRQPPPTKHRAVVRFSHLPKMLRDIDQYDEEGEAVTRLGLQLAVLTIIRTKELRQAEWRHIEGLDTDNPLWFVPDGNMKMKGRDGHLVPLSSQAVMRVHELQAITGRGRLMFPGEKTDQPISNNTMLFALYRMGYRTKQTVHGFRRLGSTIMNEAGFKGDAVEKQLAHQEKKKVRRAYNAAEYLRIRRIMLQWYADFLDALKVGAPLPPRPPIPEGIMELGDFGL